MTSPEAQGERLDFTGIVWRWTGGGPAAWHFLTITGAAAEALSATALMRRLEGHSRGFGSLRVKARIGETEWQTSVFPQKGEGWMLSIKAAVRKAEGVAEGSEVTVTLEV